MALDPRLKAVGEIRTKPFFDMVIDLQSRLDFGVGPLGRRVLFHSAGGSFEGEGLRGEVLPGGGDWALFRADTSMSLDVRLSLKTHDGALLHMTYGGRWLTPPELRADMADSSKRYFIDPSKYYYRTNPLFETGAAQYAWMMSFVWASGIWSSVGLPTKSSGFSRAGTPLRDCPEDTRPISR
jgi:hypothetical protein